MNKTIDRLLIGDNPFNGVNHLSQETSRLNTSRMTTARIARVIEVALENGVTGVSFTSSPTMYNILKHLKEQGYNKEFGMYPIFPDVTSLVRIASEKGPMGVVSETFDKINSKMKAKVLIRGGFGAITMNPTKMMNAYLEAETSMFLGASPSCAELKAIFLHEIIVDLGISLKMSKFFREYIDFVRDSLHVYPGFVTRNFPTFVDFAEDAGVEMKDIVVMTPFNKVGFQMNPSREACETCLANIPDGNVIGTSLLASGFLTIQDSVKYLLTLPTPISVAIGVSSELHARETFPHLRETLDI